MIPKQIHYCWFGKKTKPKLVLDCISSWKKELPEYEIIEWNESNFKLEVHFAKEFYRLKKFAFVSDYVRMKVLHEFGGIYLDTDILVLKSLNPFLNNKCFMGAEDSEFINCAIIGAEPKNRFVKKVVEFYESVQCNLETDLNILTIPRVVTNLYRKEFEFNGRFDKNISNELTHVYKSDYFYPLTFDNRFEAIDYKDHLTDNSYAVHLWNNSWMSHNEFHYFRNGDYKLGFRQVLVSSEVKNFRYFKKIISSLKESFKKNNE